MHILYIDTCTRTHTHTHIIHSSNLTPGFLTTQVILLSSVFVLEPWLCQGVMGEMSIKTGCFCGILGFIQMKWGSRGIFNSVYTTDWWFGTFFFFSIYWECHNPNWRTHIFQRGRYTTNQIIYGESIWWIYMRDMGFHQQWGFNHKLLWDFW